MASTALGATDNAARQVFDVFFTSHHRELGRLAYLLCGDRDAAEDITAEAFAEAWRRRANVARSGDPLANVRGILVNLAAERIRGLTRERERGRLPGVIGADSAPNPEVAAVTDVSAALARLPDRQRACVVLRHHCGLSERETARTLGISVGKVNSQTSRGVDELAAMLGTGSERGRGRRGRG